MKNRYSAMVLTLLLAGLMATGVRAQAAKPGPEQRQDDAAAVISLQVDIVISRWQGDKKVSSQPYSLSLNTGRPGFPSSGGLGNPVGPVTQVRIGNEVPVTSTITPSASSDSKTPAAPYTSTNYRHIGTQIDCSARPISQDNRFEVQISINDAGVAAGDRQPASATTPVFSSFTATNNLLLRDGQTRQFIAATDRISGEVVKADVTLKVVK